MKIKNFTIKLQRPVQGHAPSWSHGCFFWLTFLVIGLWSATTKAQSMADTLDIRFERDSTRINMDFDGNGERWSRFERSFLEKFKDLPANSLRLDIYSGASPEGAAIYNQWLGENRGNAVQQLVRRRLGSAIGHIMVHNEGPRWDGLYKAVANSNEPWRDEVLSIIEMNSSYNNKERDARELRLRELHNGSVWEVLSERYLPPLRSGASAILTWEVPAPAEAATPVVSRRDTIYIIQQSAPCPPNANQISDMKRHRKDSIYQTRLGYPAWAVKTNLLLWGVVAPNIQLEIPLGRQNRWSIFCLCNLRPLNIPIYVQQHPAFAIMCNQANLHRLFLQRALIEYYSFAHKPPPQLPIYLHRYLNYNHLTHHKFHDFHYPDNHFHHILELFLVHHLMLHQKHQPRNPA